MSVAGPLSESEEARPFPPGGVAVVFGAGGGIGRALVAALAGEAAFDRVLAFGRATTPAIDFDDEDTLEAAAAFAASAGEVRLVFGATGFLHDEGQRPEKSLRDLDAAALARAFHVNAIGPALIMKHVLPRLPRAGKAVFATLSARVGSIGDNRLGGWYGYRASKAALNQIVRTAAVELRRRAPDAVCVALHPGTVETPLSAPFGRSGLDVQTPAEAARRLVSVATRIGPEHSGGFFDARGDVVPW
jgi:NAD(P)-dependent dehydrogenase (short-subunit alcohol dehydrogenase family)